MNIALYLTHIIIMLTYNIKCYIMLTLLSTNNEEYIINVN